MKTYALAAAPLALMAGTSLATFEGWTADTEDRSCENRLARIDANFAAGAMAGCEAKRSRFLIDIEPEDTPINPSPWYAFRVTLTSDKPVEVILQYAPAKHRYYPKYSVDGLRWTYLSPKDIKISSNETRATLKLPAMSEPYFVTAQELITGPSYAAWLDDRAEAGGFELSSFGSSAEGSDLPVLSTIPMDTTPCGEIVLLLGRQHPPEVTGAMAMVPFVDEVFGDSELAKTFRERFSVVAAPLLNPDGVARGHWRHTTQGIDLNRDWGPFETTEAAAVKPFVDAVDETPWADIKLMLDFHSTNRNVFYTQTSEDVTDPADFTPTWLEAAGGRLEGVYEFERAERHQSDLPTAKNYFFDRFGAPSITYEVGDNTDRARIFNAATVFAQEMMTTLLASPRDEALSCPG